MSKRVLVVDDDMIFREILRDTLQLEGYQIDEAESGREAEGKIGLESYDAIVSDVRMANIHGLELLKWVKTNRPNIPVILMTGFADLVETQEAARLGAAGFLAKPFQKNELLKLLANCLNPQPPDREKDSGATPDEDFRKILIDDFVSGSHISQDIYVRIAENHFVKVAHSGQDLVLERISAYKKRNIRYLYMRREDFSRYLGLNLQIVRRIPASRNVEQVKKLNYLRHAGEVVLENLFKDRVDEGTFASAGAIVETSIALLEDHENAVELVHLLNQYADFVYAHSVGVSFYATLIARKLGWQSHGTLFKIGLGGLLHDVGLKEIPREILDKPRHLRTAEEVKIFETHPIRGVEILREIRSMPMDILQIVHEHQESCAGTGYPAGLHKNKIHPLARVVAVADEFSYLTMKLPGSPGMPAAEAVNTMELLVHEKLDQEAFGALKAALAL